MITKEIFHCVLLRGTSLKVDPFLNNPHLVINTYERGGDRRTYGGQILDDDILRFTVSTPTFEQFVEQLYLMKDDFEANNAETKVLYLTYGYEAQCNLEFSPATVRMIGELGLSFAISCYEDSDPE